MARRQRIDSTAARAAVAAAARRIEPPRAASLSADERRLFDAIIAEAPALEWTEHQVDTACVLARTLALLEAEQRLLAAEGTVAETDGRRAANPRAAAVATLTASVVRLRQSLGLHARAKAREPAELAERRRQAREIERQILAADDDLLN